MQSSLLLHVESIVKVCIKHLSVVFFVFFVFQSSEIALISNSTVTFIWFAFVLPNKYIHLKKNAANKTNQYFTSIKLLIILLIFLLPTFCEGYRAAAWD